MGISLASRIVWQSNKTVVLEDRASSEHDQFDKQFSRFGQSWLGAEWLLSRSADKIGVSKEMGGVVYHLAVRAGCTSGKTPNIAFVYTFDEHEVVVHAINAW